MLSGRVGRGKTCGELEGFMDNNKEFLLEFMNKSEYYYCDFAQKYNLLRKY